MEEKPVATARASVMLFDPASNTWIASGSTTGLSKVQLFRHQINNTYRVVGWKLNDKEVVLNCAIFRGMKYNQARPTFHQWRDTKHQVYGLNFTNKEEAEVFASAILEALESLNQIYRQSQQIMAQQQQQQVQVQHQQQQIEVQQGDYVNEFQPPPSGPQQCIPQQLSQQQQSVPQPSLQQPQAIQMQTPAQPPPQLPVNNYQTQLSGNTSMPEYALPQKHMHQQLNLGSLNNIGDNYGFGVPATNAIAPGSNNGPSNEYRGTPLQEEVPKVVPNSVVVAAPPPPPPPGPPPPTAEKVTDMYVCTAPPPPPGPPPLSTITMGNRSLLQSMGAQSNNDSDEDSNQSAMANQLRQARLKPRSGGTGAAIGETCNESTSSSLLAASNKCAASATSGTLGRAGGGDSMMSEMQRVLAARKKAKEVGVKVEGISDNGASGDSTAVAASTGKNSTGQWRQNHHRSQSDCEQQQLNGGAAGAQLKPVGMQSLDAGRGNTPLQCATLGRKGSLQPDQHSSQQQQQCTAGSLTRQDLDNFKREILQEVRLMIQQFKTDIIEVIRTGRP